jgi:hypothetical protein
MNEAAGGGLTLQAILRQALRDALDDDVRRREERAPFKPLYAWWWEPGDGMSLEEAEVACLRDRQASLRDRVAKGFVDDLDVEHAEELIATHGLQGVSVNRLALGLTEAAIRAIDVLIDRVRGVAPIVFAGPDDVPSPPQPTQAIAPKPSIPTGPVASALVEPFLGQRRRVAGTTEAGTRSGAKHPGAVHRDLRDLPISDYRRADMARLHDTMRRLRASVAARRPTSP